MSRHHSFIKLAVEFDTQWTIDIWQTPAAANFERQDLSRRGLQRATSFFITALAGGLGAVVVKTADMGRDRTGSACGFMEGNR